MYPCCTTRSAPSRAVTPPNRRRRPLTSSSATRLPPISPEGLHEQIARRDAVVAELAEIVCHLSGEQPIGELAADRGRDLEAMAAAAGEIRVPCDAAARPDEWIPVRCHIVERRIGLDQLHAGERRKAPLDAGLDVADELIIGGGFVIVRVDI